MNRILLVIAAISMTGCAGIPAVWRHTTPNTESYYELGYTRASEETPEKIRDPVLKTVVPEGAQDGGSFLIQKGPLQFKLHSDPATSFWMGLGTSVNSRNWGFGIGFDLSITPWPQVIEYKLDTVEGAFGFEYPVTVKREGRFSAYAVPIQFEFHPTKYFVPVLAMTPVVTGVSTSSSVTLIEPFDHADDADPFLKANLEKRRDEERSRDKNGRAMLVAALGIRSQIGDATLKALYIDRRLDSYHLNDHFRQMVQLSFGVFTGYPPTPPKSPKTGSATPSASGPQKKKTK